MPDPVPRPVVLELASNFGDTRRVFVCERFPVLVGRGSVGAPVDLELAPDVAVSRRHGQIDTDPDGFWYEDLGSLQGTLLNHREIRGQGRQPLKLGDELVLGDTTLTITESLPPQAVPATHGNPTPGEATITKSLPSFGGELTPGTTFSGAVQRHALLLDLPAAFAETGTLNALLQRVLERAVGSIPGTRRGTILLRGRDHPEALRLAAYVSDAAPAVSETLARRAMESRTGFAWQRTPGGEMAESIRHLRIESGLYAPLVWQDQCLGVVCVDTPAPGVVHGEEDLRLLLVIAHYAAMAVANHQLQDELRSNTRVLERLLTSFSPRLRERLLQQARQGKLRPGGERSDVSVLFSDICGFTRLAATMDAPEVVELLNEYFPVLAEAVFQHDGILDKFVGDAVLAVFGSPENDPLHAEKAVRAALAMQAAVQAVNARRAARGEVTCEISIGLHCGEVVHGFVGASERLDYTVIGDVVNRAFRFCTGAER